MEPDSDSPSSVIEKRGDANALIVPSANLDTQLGIFDDDDVDDPRKFEEVRTGILSPRAYSDHDGTTRANLEFRHKNHRLMRCDCAAAYKAK